MTSLSVPPATPFFIASLIVVGLLCLFVVSEGYDAAEQDIHITTAMAAAAAGRGLRRPSPDYRTLAGAWCVGNIRGDEAGALSPMIARENLHQFANASCPALGNSSQS